MPPCLTPLLILIFSLSLCRCTVTELSGAHPPMGGARLPLHVTTVTMRTHYFHDVYVILDSPIMVKSYMRIFVPARTRNRSRAHTHARMHTRNYARQQNTCARKFIRAHTRSHMRTLTHAHSHAYAFAHTYALA